MAIGKKLTGLAAIVIGAGLIAGAAMAETKAPTAGGPGWGPGTMMNGGGPGYGRGHGRGGYGCQGYDSAARIDALKTELGITKEQDPAWSTYAKALQDSAADWQAERQGMDPAAIHAMSLQDRQAYMSQRMAQHQQRYDGMKAAAEKLMPSLTDFQKGKASEVLPGLASSGRGWGGMGWGGGMGGWGGMGWGGGPNR